MKSLELSKLLFTRPVCPTRLRLRAVRAYATTRSKPQAKPRAKQSPQTLQETAKERETQLAAARARRTQQGQDTAPKATASTRQNKAQVQSETLNKLARDKEYKKRYKEVRGRWVRGIIALPILFVTSYYLFDRREFLPGWTWRDCVLMLGSRFGEPEEGDSKGFQRGLMYIYWTLQSGILDYGVQRPIQVTRWQNAHVR